MLCAKSEFVCFFKWGSLTPSIICQKKNPVEIPHQGDSIS